jgi:hypothetical protein
MDKTFVYCTAIWAAVVSFLVGSIIWGVVLQNNNNHNFDVTCINNGKAIQFVTVQGDDYAKKVCQ